MLSVYQSNVLDDTRAVTAPMWILTKMTSDITLETFIGQHRSRITFQDAIILARQLLGIIARCHRAHIFHRNLHPNHILIEGNYEQMLVREIKLVLISFGLAWIDGQQLSASETDDRAIFEQVMQRQSPDSQSFLADNHHCNTILDSTGVCRVLFWLLTDDWMVDTGSPSVHRDKLGTPLLADFLESSYVLFLGNTHLHPRIKSLFNRAFGSFEDRWTVDQLGKELEAIELEAAELDTLFPASTVTSFSTLTDPYARAISLLAEAKQQFSEKYSTCIKWSEEKNTWYIGANANEVRNTDELIYDYQGKRCQLIVECSASIHVGPITLNISSHALGETKLVCETTRDFDDALKKLPRDKLK